MYFRNVVRQNSKRQSIEFDVGLHIFFLEQVFAILPNFQDNFFLLSPTHLLLVSIEVLEKARSALCLSLSQTAFFLVLLLLCFRLRSKRPEMTHKSAQ